jgi:hypothetical protein
MAIKKTGGESAEVSQDNAGPQQGYTYQPQSTGDDLFSGIGVETLSGGVDTEGFAAFSAEMERLSKLPEVLRTIKLSVIPVSNQHLRLPVLAMAAESKDGVVVYSLLIEGMMGQPLEPIREIRRDFGGPQGAEIIIDRPTSRCYDNGLRKIVAAAVATQLNTSAERIVHQSHCVVPRGANLKCAETCRSFFDSANLALTNAVARDRIAGVTVANLTNPAGVVNQRTTITPGQNKLNKIGLPIAADFTTTIELARKAQEKTSWSSDIHVAQQRYHLAEVSGYIDFSVAGPIPPKPNMNPMLPQTVPGYIPMVVITEIAGLANNGSSIEDMRTQLLGIAATTALTADHGWVRVFEKMAGAKSVKADIGLLGLEHDPYIGRTPELGMVSVDSISYGKQPKEGTMTPKQVADLWCTDKVAVALDVEQGGRLHWIQDIFVAASGVGDETGRRTAANERIIAECDVLTNGIFSRLWTELNGGQKAHVVATETVAVHLGTYDGGKNGGRRDLRSIDYLTMLGQMPKDLEKLSAATAATIPGGCNAITLTDRRNAIENIVGDCEFTGMATRVFLTGGFINTFVRALIQAGVTFRSDDLLGYGQSSQRVVMNYNLAGTASEGLYQTAYQQGSVPGIPGGAGYINPLF